ncbi:MAG: hypothetical protein QM633_15125, partial [Propionicimonas sp.]
MLLAAFSLSGVISFSWLARVPGVRDDLHLGAAELGVVLLVGSIGALVTVFTAPLALGRVGSARMFAAGSVVMTAGFTLMGVGPALGSLPVFGAGTVLNGIGGALLNLPMNVESARIEQAFGRAVIPHFHAAFSLGAVGGSVLGAGAAALGVPVVAQFAVVGVLVGALRLAALGAGLVMPGVPRPTVGPASPQAARSRGRSAWTEPRT